MRNGRRRRETAAPTRASRRSSTNSRRIVKGRPPRVTLASPSLSISSTLGPNWPMTCLASDGAPMVTSAFNPFSLSAASIEAVPPSEWPTSSETGRPCSAIQLAAASISSTLELIPLSENSPSDSPMPVKSNRRTPIPRSAKARDRPTAARDCFEHVKQWAKMAQPTNWPTGCSRRPAICWPSLPEKLTFSLNMTPPGLRGLPCAHRCVEGVLPVQAGQSGGQLSSSGATAGMSVRGRRLRLIVKARTPPAMRKMKGDAQSSMPPSPREGGRNRTKSP